MKHEHQVEVAVYRATPSQRGDVNELDYGALLASLTEAHWSFQVTTEDGSHELEDGPLYVRVNRAHEWQLILDFIAFGGGIFAKKIIEKIAERIFDWAVSQGKKLRTKTQPILVSPEGTRVAIDGQSRDSSINGIEQLLEVAAAKKLRVQLIIEPTS